MDKKPQRRILYVQTAFLGDLLLSIPSLKHLKILYPEVVVSIICRQGLSSIFLQYGLCDHAFEIEKKNKASYRKILDTLKNDEFDIIFCPHESLTSALLVTRLKAKVKIGFKQWWNFFAFNTRVQKNLRLPEAIRQMSLLAAVDADLNSKIATLPQDQTLFTVPDWASTNIVPYQGLKNSVCLFPGSVWPTKMWTEKGFIQLGKYLNEKSFQVILMGSKAEKDLCDRIEKQLSNVENRAGKTNLLESLSVVSECKAVISNDSGGQHLASLCSAPTLSIFGPTVLKQGFRPWNNQIEIAEVQGLICRPCGKHGHKACPLGTHECMKNLSTAEVIAKFEQLLMKSL